VLSCLPGRAWKRGCRPARFSSSVSTWEGPELGLEFSGRWCVLGVVGSAGGSNSKLLGPTAPADPNPRCQTRLR
jgi:hypothetical protein